MYINGLDTKHTHTGLDLLFCQARKEWIGKAFTHLSSQTFIYAVDVLTQLYSDLHKQTCYHYNF